MNALLDGGMMHAYLLMPLIIAYYQHMIDVIASCGPSFKGLSLHDISDSLLQNEV